MKKNFVLLFVMTMAQTMAQDKKTTTIIVNNASLAQEQKYITEIKLEVPLRNSPELIYKTMGITLPKGEMVELLDYKNDFWFVTNGDFMGWLPTSALYRISSMQEKIVEYRTKSVIEKYGESDGKKILAGGIWLGMSQEMLEESKGLPDSVKKIIIGQQEMFQHVYGKTYVYLMDSKVMDIQNW
jgi:hypothetical protein